MKLRTRALTGWMLACVIAVATAITAGAIDTGAQQWESITPMASSRNSHASVIDSQGRIYAIGSPGLTTGKSVERFDPATGKWTSLPNMTTNRYLYLTAVIDNQDRVYAIGGDADRGSERTVERFDPATNQWTLLASMISTRNRHTSTIDSDGRIYAIGGVADGIHSSSVERYDPSTNQWTALPQMNEARYGHGTVVDSDGRIYAIGGASTSALRSVERFDPATNRWTILPAMNMARSSHAVAIDSKDQIYAFGSDYSAERFDPSLGRWSLLPQMTDPRAHSTVTVDARDRVYAIGGLGYTTSLSTVERFDPIKGTWEALSKMAASRYRATSVMGLDGYIYVIGGSGPTDGRSAERYDTEPPPSVTRSLPRLGIPDRGAKGRVDVGDQVTYSVTISSGGAATLEQLSIRGDDFARSNYVAKVVEVLDEDTRSPLSISSTNPSDLRLLPRQRATISISFTASRADVSSDILQVGAASVESSINGAPPEALETVAAVQMETGSLGASVGETTYSLATDSYPIFTGDRRVSIGDVLAINIPIHNTGDTDLSVTAGADQISVAAGAIGSLTASHTVTRSDLDAGRVKDAYVVTAWPVWYANARENADAVLAFNEILDIPTVPVVATLPLDGAVVEVDGIIVAKGSRLPAGTEAAFTYTPRNTGTVPIVGLTAKITAQSGLSTLRCAETTLAPGAQTTCTARLSLIGR